MTEQRTFTATIGRRNDNGFQIVERPGVWLNLSRFDDPQPVIPPLGSTARITVDEKNYVRAIEPQADPQQPPSAPRTPAAPAGDRDRTITRLALIKAAARFLADKPAATSVDVTLVAEKWARWIGRESEE